MTWIRAPQRFPLFFRDKFDRLICIDKCHTCGGIVRISYPYVWSDPLEEEKPIPAPPKPKQTPPMPIPPRKVRRWC